MVFQISMMILLRSSLVSSASLFSALKFLMRKVDLQSLFFRRWNKRKKSALYTNQLFQFKSRTLFFFYINVEEKQKDLAALHCVGKNLCISTYSSEMRGLCLRKLSSEMHQNLPCFWNNKKPQIVFFWFSISCNFGF